MKKLNICKTILGFGCAAIAPTTTFLTSCNNRQNKWVSTNFVEVLFAGDYNPVVGPANDPGLSTDDQIIEFYLNNIKNNPQILKDEICHTANILRSNSNVTRDFGVARECIYKVQWNIGSVDVDVKAHTINYTLGAYLAGNWLGEISQTKYNYFQNINLYMEIRPTSPIKIVSIERNPYQFFTDENVITIESTNKAREGNLLNLPYQLTMIGYFWYYNSAGELRKFDDIKITNQTMNKNAELSINEAIYTQLANKYSFLFSRYLAKNPEVYNQMYISSSYLEKFKQPNTK